MLGKNKFIERLKIKNLLSFSSEGIDLELESLNVLIGPNASGKSNLIEALGLLKSLPTDFAKAVRDCGGINDMLWKGAEKTPEAEIEATIHYPVGLHSLCHYISFTQAGERLELSVELIADNPPSYIGPPDYPHYYAYAQGEAAIRAKTNDELQSAPIGERTLRFLRPEDFLPNQSILAQRKEPDNYPEIAYLNSLYGNIKLFREWNMGRNALVRQPQKTDVNGDFLNESFDNLSLVLNDLEFRTDMKKRILDHLKTVHGRVQDIRTKTQMGQIQLYIDEGRNGMIPATRLSDGTIRYLCLLVILCHPSPPALICLEEPELGLHPDIIPEVGKLLIEASHRTQLVVTTHSPSLISALGDVPEAVVVCENHGDHTEMKRLNKEDLSNWLGEYELGDVWMTGELGGARW